MLNSSPETPQLYLQNSQYLLELGKIDRAISEIKKALALDVNFVSALSELATIYQQQDKLNLALEYRQKIVRLQPTNHYVYADLCEVLLAQNRVEDAILVYKKSLSLPDTPIFIYSGLAQAFERDGQVENAILVYQHTIKLFADHAELKISLAECIARQKQTDYRKININSDDAAVGQDIKPYAYFFQQGRDSIIRGDYEKAIAVYTEGNQQYKNHPFSYFMLGHAYSFIGDYSQELSYYYQALDYDTNNSREADIRGDLSENTYPTLNKNQINNIYQKIVDASINARQTEDLPALVERAKERIDDYNFYLKNAHKLAKLENFVEAIAFIKEADSKYVELDYPGAEYDEIQYLSASLNQAKENKAAIKDCNYKIISLGSDCLPRTISTIWGLKPRKHSGELSCPFDLALHPYESVVKAIEKDFDNYLNSAHLISYSIEKGYDSNEKFSCIKNTYYNCLFTHERGDKFSNANFAQFIDVYRQRISNFYQYINSGPILFLVYSDCSIEINTLVRALSNKFPQLQFKVMLVLFGKNINLPSKPVDSKVITYHIPGFDEYRWPTMSSTRIEYERTISNAIKQVILNNF